MERKRLAAALRGDGVQILAAFLHRHQDRGRMLQAPFLLAFQSQHSAVGASSTHFVPPCRQHWHLHCVAMTWDHTPQKHLTLPKSPSSSPHPPKLYFYLLSRKSGCWTAAELRLGMLQPPCRCWWQKLQPQHFCSALSAGPWYFFACLGNGIEQSLSLLRKY